MDRTPSITDDEIKALAREAWEHGDDAMNIECRIALDPDILPSRRNKARKVIADAINAARAADTDSERRAAEIDAMSPSECWEVYVGSQMPATFMADACVEGVEAACLHYVAHSPACDDLPVTAAITLGHKLAAYIPTCGSCGRLACPEWSVGSRLFCRKCSSIPF